MSMDDNDVLLLATCANCGKGEEDSANLKACAACKIVKHCNVSCQKAHRSQHKKECRKRAAELHDEKLFKQPPQLNEECPICFMRMPSLDTGWKYNTCCGKMICCGCVYAGAMTGEEKLCPFCRTPQPRSDEEIVDMLKKRVDINDARAIYNLGCGYSQGLYGLPQDRDKALELWHRAGELGNTESDCCIGNSYRNGHGVDRDVKKATHYYELAAMEGNVNARSNLGSIEVLAGNIDRALKHLMIAAGGGSNESLKMIQRMYKNGHAVKDDYMNALRAYQTYLGEVKSDDRDKDAAFNRVNRYYE